MNILSSLLVVALAALIHASFQLSVSVLTLLSGHAIGSKRSHAKLVRTTTAFIFGAGIMTLLLLSFISYVIFSIYGSEIPKIIWATVCGLTFGVATAVWMFYYRREKGTSLWIPRNVAEFLIDRTKATRMSAEAFGLGLSSILGELLFIIAPITISALVIIQLPPLWQLAAICIYTLISLISLITVGVLITNGRAISHIQKWRETNKYFLQFAAGAGLIALGLFVFVNEIISNSNIGIF